MRDDSSTLLRGTTDLDASVKTEKPRKISLTPNQPQIKYTIVISEISILASKNQQN